jgi:hypothetical protein
MFRKGPGHGNDGMLCNTPNNIFLGLDSCEEFFCVVWSGPFVTG